MQISPAFDAIFCASAVVSYLGGDRDLKICNQRDERSQVIAVESATKGVVDNTDCSSSGHYLEGCGAAMT